MLESGWWRGGRIIAAALLLAASAGCSLLGLAYGQAERLAYGWLDGQFGFTDAQQPAVRRAVARWAAWHRGSELPLLAGLLERAADEVLQDTAPQRVCTWIDALRQRGQAAVEQALPELAGLASGFDEPQLARIAARQAAAATGWRGEFAEATPEDRAQVTLKRTLERYQTLYGRLDAPQRERLARGLTASPFDAARWIGERERRQRDLIETLRRLRAEDADTAVESLRGVVRRVLSPPDPAYRDHAARLQAHHCEFAAEMHNGMSAAQRQAARQRLLGWRKDLLRYAPDPT